VTTAEEPRRKYLDLVAKIILNEINPENGARIKYLLDAVCEAEPGRDRNDVLRTLVGLHNSDEKVRAALDDLYRPRHWWTKTLGFPFSMIGPERLANTREAAETVIAENIPGAMVETGVWRGGACIMMKAVMSAYGVSRPLYVCDSFAGLPKLTEGPDAVLTLDENPLLSAPVEDVRSHFERLDLLDDDVHFVKGWFEDTMPELARSGPEAIAVLRLDGDYYHSTMVVLENLYDKVSPGGFVIIDDYHAYEQCAQAVNEYRAAKGITDEMIEIDGVGIYWRVGAA